MKKTNKYFCLLLLLIKMIPVYAQEEQFRTKDYSKISIEQLDADFILAVQAHDSKKTQELMQAGAIETLLETPGIDPHHVNKNGETALTLLEKLNKKMSGYPY